MGLFVTLSLAGWSLDMPEASWPNGSLLVKMKRAPRLNFRCISVKKWTELQMEDMLERKFELSCREILKGVYHWPSFLMQSETGQSLCFLCRTDAEAWRSLGRDFVRDMMAWKKIEAFVFSYHDQEDGEIVGLALKEDYFYGMVQKISFAPRYEGRRRVLRVQDIDECWRGILECERVLNDERVRELEELVKAETLGCFLEMRTEIFQ